MGLTSASSLKALLVNRKRKKREWKYKPYYLRLVFEGPVYATGNPTATGPNQTDCNRTTGCGCSLFLFFRLPVALFLK